MTTFEDWPLGKIHANFNRNGNGVAKPLAVLVTTGAMNPVHHGHIKILELAANHMTSIGYNVVGGFLVPNGDAYLESKAQKLKKKNPNSDFSYFSAETRLALCKEALKDHPFIDVAGYEANQGKFINFPEVVEALDNILNFDGHFATIVYVCGADLIRRAEGFKGFSNGIHMCVVDREGESVDLSQILNAHSVKTTNDISDMSSTEFRKNLHKLIDVEQTRDLSTLSHLVTSDTLKYISDNLIKVDSDMKLYLVENN